MRFIQSVWKDIKQGENLDLYITVLISIILAILNVLNIAPTSLTAPLYLTVLSLLAVTILGNRHRLEKILDGITQGTNKVFYKNYPSDIEKELVDKLEQCAELIITGSSIERTLHLHFHVLEQKLRKGDRIRVILVDPHGSACEMTTLRKYRPINNDVQRAKILASIETLNTLKAQTSGNLEIRLLNYPLSHGGIIVNPDTSEGALFLWYYGFKTHAAHSPKFVLRPADGYWYTHFKEEIEAMWKEAVTYDTWKL